MRILCFDLMNGDSRLTLSIRVSVRLFSSYQNDVGISKSVSWGATLRSFVPGKKQEQQKTIWAEAWSDISLCEEVLTHCADLKGPALTEATDQRLYFFLSFLLRKAETEGTTKPNGWNHLFSRASSHSLCPVRVDWSQCCQTADHAGSQTFNRFIRPGVSTLCEPRLRHRHDEVKGTDTRWW